VSDRIGIIVADDHGLVREMLRERLSREPDMTILGTAGTADEAVALAVRLAPDVVVMDIDMPGRLCFDAARAIRTRCPHTRVIFLSALCQDRYIDQALQVQAYGYVVKTEPPDVIVRAIRGVAAGSSYFSPEVQARIVVDQGGPRLADQQRSRASSLTPREMEVLRYIARGLSKQDIGRAMHLSAGTVHRHTANLMNKLNIHDRVELTRFAIREGLAEP
jgi:DNA-binding NarL/FixJ family response regulator